MRAWGHGLAAAFISGLSDAFLLHLTDPEVFNRSLEGMKATLAFCILKAMLSVALYLKKSPLPE